MTLYVSNTGTLSCLNSSKTCSYDLPIYCPDVIPVGYGVNCESLTIKVINTGH